MAYKVDNAGNYAVNDAGEFEVDNGATITNWNPVTEVSALGEVTLNTSVTGELQIFAVGNPGGEDINWVVGGPDALEFGGGDNDDGSYTLQWLGITPGNYDIIVTATNSAGSDARQLLINISAAGLLAGARNLLGVGG